MEPLSATRPRSLAENSPQPREPDEDAFLIQNPIAKNQTGRA
jgi:hypothetical protein